MVSEVEQIRKREGLLKETIVLFNSDYECDCEECKRGEL